MAISRGHCFPIEFADAFPQGLVLMGEVTPGNEYQSRERNAKRASFEVTFLADVQPVPTTAEVLPGVRPIELDGVTAEPRVAGNGEFKFQSFVFRATGFNATGAAGATRTAGKASDTTNKAA